MTIKETLYKQCQDFIADRHKSIVEAIAEIELALQSETKSSAGDKHETGRAMMQLEREKAGNRLAEISKLKAVLSRIDTHMDSETIRLGSVVYTTAHNYYIALSAGLFTVGQESFYAISTGTPIGKLLMGKTAGEEIAFGGRKLRVTQVC